VAFLALTPDALFKTEGAVGKPKARKAIEALTPHLLEAGLGTISEIFDGDAPHAPAAARRRPGASAKRFAWSRIPRSPSEEAPLQGRDPEDECVAAQGPGKTVDV
jgi:hypothetical protein